MKLTLLAAAILIAATPAFAHLNPNENGVLMAGLSHPVFGLDHILAMIAVGLWAALLGGRALWALPGVFIGAMAIGFSVTIAELIIPFVEPMILISVFVLGFAVALTLRLPLFAAAGIAAVFGLFHGYAHGGESTAAGALAFGAGLAISTAFLHSVGIAFAVAAGRAVSGSKILQGLGWGTALGGLWIALGV